MAGKDPRDTLKEVLGEKAAVLLARSPNAEVFQKALAAVEKEKSEELEKVAAEKIKAALAKEQEITALEKEFNGKLAKAKKALGKLLGPLRQMAQGQPVQEEGEGGGDEGQQQEGEGG